jgi:hypothetical protein
MRLPPDRITPEEEKKKRLKMILAVSGGRAGAIEYLKYVKQTLNPEAVQIGVRHLSTSLI